MTQEITTQVKDKVILFYDGSKVFVTEKQARYITEKEMEGVNQFRLPNGDGIIKANAISKILSVDEYYNQYPKERPVEYPRHDYQPQKPWNLAKTKNAIIEFLKGYEAEKVKIHGKQGWESKKETDEHYPKILKRVKELS